MNTKWQITSTKEYLIDILGSVWLSIAEHVFSDGYWKKKCRVCGFEREWHLYGLFSLKRVWVDGMGTVSCNQLRKK